jgi:CheY-like chemotaxis protein
VPYVRVLIVDDLEPFRQAASAVVGATPGFVVVGTAVDGEESLAAVDEQRPDLVLMDVNLPGIDGLEATRRIRSREDAPVVVLLSTYEFSDIGGEAFSCGARAYLTKAEFDSDWLRQVWDGLGS